MPADKFDEMARECELRWFEANMSRADVEALGDDVRCDLCARIAALVRRAVEEARADAGVAGEIRAERERQKSVEGWTESHDDEHVGGDLACAAACYAIPEAHRRLVLKSMCGEYIAWPFEWSAFKPKDARSDLIRAAALIVAEIERLDRAAAIRARAAKEGK